MDTLKLLSVGLKWVKAGTSGWFGLSSGVGLAYRLVLVVDIHRGSSDEAAGRRHIRLVWRPARRANEAAIVVVCGLSP